MGFWNGKPYQIMIIFFLMKTNIFVETGRYYLSIAIHIFQMSILPLSEKYFPFSDIELTIFRFSKKRFPIAGWIWRFSPFQIQRYGIRFLNHKLRLNHLYSELTNKFWLDYIFFLEEYRYREIYDLGHVFCLYAMPSVIATKYAPININYPENR